MEVKAIEGHIARCSAKGVERDVNLFLLQDQTIRQGDYVMVHVGYAIQKVTHHDARTAWALYDQMTGGGQDHA
jgi:hydrogenase expression/formation protein HypC